MIVEKKIMIMGMMMVVVMRMRMMTSIKDGEG